VLWFEEHGVEAVHAADLENGLRLPDLTLWQIAKEKDWIKGYGFF